jgi:LytS/YehU family sensor histidine kinase
MNGNRIAIEKEIQYLQDYIDLQKLRKEGQCIIEYICPPEVIGFTIEPLLLIPFVENAFKHISHNTDQPDFIKIRLAMGKGEFIFSIENSGIGLTNVKRRLDLLYPKKHTLLINDEADIFRVVLTIKI